LKSNFFFFSSKPFYAWKEGKTVITVPCLDVMGADVYQNVMEGLRHPNRLSLKPAQEWIFKISHSE